MNSADYEIAVRSRYASLDTKVMKGWPAEKEEAWKALLAACGGTADDEAPDDVLDYSDSTWARAEGLVENKLAPELDRERMALHRYRKVEEQT